MLSVTHIGVIAGVPGRLAERRVGEGHQHAAMDDAAHVDVPLVDAKAETPRTLCALLEHRTDMDLERIDQPGLREAGRARTSQTIFHRPVATATGRSPTTISAERNTIVRVWRVTRTRTRSHRPAFPARRSRRSARRCCTAGHRWRHARSGSWQCRPRSSARRHAGCRSRSCAFRQRSARSGAPRRRAGGARSGPRAG